MAGMNFEVRRAVLADLDDLIDFTIEEAREAEGITKSRDDVREGVGFGLKDDAVAMYWVLGNDSALAGRISIVKEWSDWNAGYYWWIQSMYLKPEFRGKGWMEKLMGTVRQAARDGGALELRLYVHRNNHKAIRAYQKVGFAESEYRIMTSFV
jgi:GNAT superfamily N-acetyltransferase